MRQYLLIFWGLVLGGMMLLTAVYTASPQSIAARCYRVYDADGQVTYTGSNTADAGIRTAL